MGRVVADVVRRDQGRARGDDAGVGARAGREGYGQRSVPRADGHGTVQLVAG